MLIRDKAEILDKMGIEILPRTPGTTEEKIRHMETNLGYDILPHSMSAGRIFASSDIGNFPDYTYQHKCGHCGLDVAGIVVASYSTRNIRWVGCPACLKGSVVNSDVITPTPFLGDDVQGLEDPIKGAYLEARKSLSSKSYTACVLMCRKILMNVAVNKDAPQKKQFIDYVNYLVEKGHITPTMQVWVDKIREIGNEATHEIPPPDDEKANTALTFTALLLRNVYETAHLLKPKTDDAEN